MESYGNRFLVLFRDLLWIIVYLNTLVELKSQEKRMPHLVSNVGCRKVIYKANDISGYLLFINVLLSCVLRKIWINHVLLMQFIGPYIQILFNSLYIKWFDHCMVFLGWCFLCKFPRVYIQRWWDFTEKNSRLIRSWLVWLIISILNGLLVCILLIRLLISFLNLNWALALVYWAEIYWNNEKERWSFMVIGSSLKF